MEKWREFFKPILKKLRESYVYGKLFLELTVALTLMASASDGVGVMSNASERGLKSGMEAGPLDKLLEFISEL